MLDGRSRDVYNVQPNVLVFPGLELVLARFTLFIMELIKELFPTLDLPMKAYSGKFGSGQSCHFPLLFTNSAVLMTIYDFFSNLIK